MNSDEEHLNLLAIFHYVVAVFCALFSMFPVIHLMMGVGMITGIFPPDKAQDPVPVALGWFFVVLASVLILCGLTFAACLVFAGRSLTRHQHYVFCLVVAAFSCMFAPFGTVLGVFTIIVLMRPSVKELFGQTTPLVPARDAGG